MYCGLQKIRNFFNVKIPIIFPSDDLVCYVVVEPETRMVVTGWFPQIRLMQLDWSSLKIKVKI